MKTILSEDVGEKVVVSLDELCGEHFLTIQAGDNAITIREIDTIENLYNFLARGIWEIH